MKLPSVTDVTQVWILAFMQKNLVDWVVLGQKLRGGITVKASESISEKS